MLDFDSRENLCYRFLNFFEENTMKIRNEMVALEANLSDIETPTQRIVKNTKTDICAETTCEVQTIIQSHHGWINYAAAKEHSFCSFSNANSPTLLLKRELFRGHSRRLP